MPLARTHPLRPWQLSLPPTCFSFLPTAHTVHLAPRGLLCILPCPFRRCPVVPANLTYPVGPSRSTTHECLRTAAPFYFPHVLAISTAPHRPLRVIADFHARSRAPTHHTGPYLPVRARTHGHTQPYSHQLTRACCTSPLHPRSRNSASQAWPTVAVLFPPVIPSNSVHAHNACPWRPPSVFSGGAAAEATLPPNASYSDCPN